MSFKKLQDQKLALYCCQRSLRAYMMSKTWLWMQLWLMIKPHLKCTQFGKYKKEYEETIAIAEANIDKAVADCSAVVEIHTKLSAEKNELVLALQSGGSAVQVLHQETFLSGIDTKFPRKSLTRPTGLREQRTICRSRLMRPTPGSRARTTRSTRSSRPEPRLYSFK